jgi:hypothetical protein
VAMILQTQQRHTSAQQCEQLAMIMTTRLAGRRTQLTVGK